MSPISSQMPNIQAGRSMMNSRIASAVSTGTVSSTDQTAFASALDSIDASLSGKTASSAGSMKERISSLIDSQVSGGTLTEAQASQLKEFFTPQSGGGGSGGGRAEGAGGPPPPGGPGGPGGPPPSAQGDDAAGATDDTSTEVASTDDQLAKMIDLLSKLRESLQSNGTYGSSSTGLLVDALA